MTLEYRDKYEGDQIADIQPNNNVSGGPELPIGEDAEVEAADRYFSHWKNTQIEQLIPKVNLRKHKASETAFMNIVILGLT